MCRFRRSARNRREAQLAAALRRAACEPELYAKPIAEVERQLALPAGCKVAFNGVDGLSFKVDPMPDTRALIAALGIDKPVAKLRWQTYHASWWLGSDAVSGELDRFQPGKLQIQVKHDAARSDPEGKVVSWSPSMVAASELWVSMPRGVVTMKPDAEGLKQLVTAMELLAANEATLGRDPEAVAKQLELEGERFLVARTSLHHAGTSVDGISLQPQRTLILGDALASALGLEGARAMNTNREHDKWAIAVSGSTTVHWRGLELDVIVDPKEKDERETTLEGAEVRFVSLLPGGASRK